MSSDEEQTKDEWSPMGAWLKSVLDLWLSAATAWSGMSGPSRDSSGSRATERDDFQTRFEEAWQKPFKLFQTLFSTPGDLAGLNAFIAGTGAIPDVSMRMIQGGCAAYAQLYQQWLSKAGKSAESGRPYRFADFDKNMYKTWTEIYQKQIHPILNIPQLGLNRFYQERFQHAVDKYNLHQAAMADFMRLIFKPIEKSLQEMDKELERLGTQGKFPENFKDYYQIWIKVLEGHYMILFKSQDYTDSLGLMLSTLGDFKTAQHKMLSDILQELPIPTNRDMDGLYKEIYQLKKKVKQLSNKVETPEVSASRSTKG